MTDKLKTGAVSAKQTRLLLVDDDEDIRAGVRELLEIEGYAVREASNGKEALELLESCPRPCMVLLDLMMPVMSGYEVLEVLRQRPEYREGLDVIIMSAARDLPPPQPPVKAVLRKPFDLSVLMRAVQAHCG